MRIKTKNVSVAYPDDCNVRVSNCIKIIDKQHICFDPPSGLKKSLIHEK